MPMPELPGQRPATGMSPGCPYPNTRHAAPAEASSRTCHSPARKIPGSSRPSLSKSATTGRSPARPNRNRMTVLPPRVPGGGHAPVRHGPPGPGWHRHLRQPAARYRVARLRLRWCAGPGRVLCPRRAVSTFPKCFRFERAPSQLAAALPRTTSPRSDWLPRAPALWSRLSRPPLHRLTRPLSVGLARSGPAVQRAPLPRQEAARKPRR
jgi:hypothetical protein